MPARDDDKAMDGLLRRSLARDAAKAGECPDADILAAYYERSLDADEVAGYEQHISQCALCREHLAALVRAESAVEIPAEPVLVAAAALAQPAKAATPERVSTPEKPAPLWVFDWRWLAPAAAALIFAAVVYVRVIQHGPTALFSRNEVAVSKPQTAPSPPPAEELYAPAERLQANHESPANPPATLKSNLPSLQKKMAAPPPPSRAEKESAAPPAPPPAKPAAPPPRVSPGPSVARTSPGASSGFIGGAMARRGTAAGTAAPRIASRQQTPAPSTSAKTAQSEQRAASGTSAGAASATAATATATPQADAKKESEVADASAQSVQTTAANDQAKAPVVAGAPAGRQLSSLSQTVEVTAASEAVYVAEKIGALYRVTPDGLVERSSDGGATWRPERLKTKAPIVAASAPSGEICWLVGRDGTILVTKNAKKWKKIWPPAAIDLIAVTAQDAKSATVTASDGRKFSTTDGGKTWKQLKQ